MDKELIEIYDEMIKQNEKAKQKQQEDVKLSAAYMGSLLYLAEGLANALEERLINDQIRPTTSEEYLIVRAKEVIKLVQNGEPL